MIFEFFHNINNILVSISGLLASIFSNLFDEDVISGAVFKAWRDSAEEPQGKGMCPVYRFIISKYTTNYRNGFSSMKSKQFYYTIEMSYNYKQFFFLHSFSGVALKNLRTFFEVIDEEVEEEENEDVDSSGSQKK